jgi:hypothetical protein
MLSYGREGSVWNAFELRSALLGDLSSILQMLTWVAGHHSDRSFLCCQPLVQLTHKQQVAQLALGLRSDRSAECDADVCTEELQRKAFLPGMLRHLVVVRLV